MELRCCSTAFLAGQHIGVLLRGSCHSVFVLVEIKPQRSLDADRFAAGLVIVRFYRAMATIKGKPTQLTISPGSLSASTTRVHRTRDPDFPMRLLCLGVSRTGTTSLRHALHLLGYKAYHGWNLIESPADNPVWREALEAKFEGRGKVWSTAEEFDRVLGDSDAVIDVPASAFVEELVRVYPEANVIITVRDKDRWWK
jgi:hypothetical protein